MQAAVLVTAMGVLGALVGSFLAAVSVRLPRSESVVGGRSHCMSCERPLAVWQLVPIFSWLAQRGRCGWCKAPVSARYILIEVAAVGVGIWAALVREDPGAIAITALLGWQLLLIAIIDAENFWLPDVLTLPLIASGLALAFLTDPFPWDHVLGALAGFASLWTIAAVYRVIRRRDGLGAGDPILLAGAGAWVGWIGLPSVLLWACAAGVSLIVARIVARRPVSATDKLPFGSYLALGVWLTWVFGPLGL